MTKEERQDWVRRGYPDPRVAYRTHAANAAQRGIEFKLTFDEWWGLWAEHYTQRGRSAGMKHMCRTGDQGAYEVGNVRIDTMEANHAERSDVFRARNVEAGRLPLAKDRPVLAFQDPDSWLSGRRHVFKPYTESDEDYDA